MKAIVQRKFGSPDVLELREIEKPVPGDDQVLLKIAAVSLNAYDWRHVRADPLLLRLMGGGLLKPKHPVLGADMAGTVEAGQPVL
jgi:NADPH:quinone reductase-like Zn-dependent oxidoreductase